MKHGGAISTSKQHNIYTFVNLHFILCSAFNEHTRSACSHLCPGQSLPTDFLFFFRDVGCVHCTSSLVMFLFYFCSSVLVRLKPAKVLLSLRAVICLININYIFHLSSNSKPAAMKTRSNNRVCPNFFPQKTCLVQMLWKFFLIYFILNKTNKAPQQNRDRCRV